MGLQERQGWYVDDIASFTDKDNYMKMLGHLILNDDEMVATKNATFEEAKSFISQLTLYFRKPYAKAPIEYPKNFVIARTTNDDTYLKDKTGDRRFLPVYVDKNKQKYHPVTDLTDELVDLLWGEFVHYYKQGFSFNLTQEQLEMLEDNREPFKYVDDFEDKLIRYLDTDIPIDFYSAGNKTKHARYFYITEIMEFGESDTHEFLGHETKPRDFVTAPRFLWEVFQENAGKGGTGKNSNKFHNIMKHRKGWQSATRRGTRGYKRK
jgi:predicted P-loop ATPase